MPTGVAILDPRTQLFDAAERVLLREGQSALTSRAITAEAGCAKGVLHRHFTDIDAFLAELVLDRIGRINIQAGDLLDNAGIGNLVVYLTGALENVFGPVALAILGLVISRDALRARLRETTPTGVPLLAQAKTMIASYLRAEQELGRIDAGADVETLALTLIGAGHLLFAGREGTPPTEEEVRKVVTAVLADVLPQPR